LPRCFLLLDHDSALVDPILASFLSYSCTDTSGDSTGACTRVESVTPIIGFFLLESLFLYLKLGDCILVLIFAANHAITSSFWFISSALGRGTTMKLVEVTVKVPQSKLALLYRLVGDLVEEVQTEEESRLVPWTRSDYNLAMEHWRKLSPTAQKLYWVVSLMTPSKISGAELAQKSGGSRGSRGIPGALAWPSRYAHKVGRVAPISSETKDGGTYYWMREEAAELFIKAHFSAQSSDSDPF
jgi:hypothetical protein